MFEINYLLTYMMVFDTSTPEVYSRNDSKSPISQAILDLIKEKHRLRWLYNNRQDPNIKSTINKFQREIRTKINQESTIREQSLRMLKTGVEEILLGYETIF